MMRVPEVAAVFADDTMVEHARQQQAQHWKRMFREAGSAEYRASVERIGRTHARLGLEPGRYIDGYDVVKTHLHALALDLFQARRSPAAARRRCTMLIQARDKLVFPDMHLVCGLYSEEKGWDQ